MDSMRVDTMTVLPGGVRRLRVKRPDGDEYSVAVLTDVQGRLYLSVCGPWGQPLTMRETDPSHGMRSFWFDTIGE